MITSQSPPYHNPDQGKCSDRRLPVSVSVRCRRDLGFTGWGVSLGNRESDEHQRYYAVAPFGAKLSCEVTSRSARNNAQRFGLALLPADLHCKAFNQGRMVSNNLESAVSVLRPRGSCWSDRLGVLKISGQNGIFLVCVVNAVIF